MLVAYPIAFPSQEVISVLTSAIRAQVKTPEAAHIGWNVQGYLQGITLPVSGSSAVVAGAGEAVPADTESPEAQAKLIEDVAGALNTEAKSFPVWLIPIAIQIITKFLAK